MKNAKHKLFADTYLANGMNATQAYKEVYKCKDDVAPAAASRLLTNVKVAEYIKEAQETKGEELQTKYGLSVEGQINKLIAAEEFARGCDNPSALIKAIEAQNKLADLNPTEKKEIEVTGLPTLNIIGLE